MSLQNGGSVTVAGGAGGRALAADLGDVFPQCSRELGEHVDPAAALRDDDSSGGSLLDRLRADAPAAVRLGLLGQAEERDGGRVVAVPSGFVRDQLAQRFAYELRSRAVELGVARVELVVDATLPLPAPRESASTAPAAQTPPRRVRTPAAERALPAGVVAKLVAERGYWSLTPTSERWSCNDIKGRLVVEPSSLGACGVSEAIVFTGLVTIWGNGARTEPVVETSLHQLARILRLSWSGRVAELLRRSIERLKTTTYRATVTTDEGGAERLFSILDEIETTWTGPETSPHRHVRAVFSRTTMELVSAPRMLRPIDLDALRRLGAQRDLARRLFLFLEASTGHPHKGGVEIVERIIDQRLAATLGSPATPGRLASQLDAASAAIEQVSDRYLAVRVIERRKKCLAPGEAVWALRATRRRLTRSRAAS